MSIQEVRNEIARLQAVLKELEQKELADLSAAKKAHLLGWELRTGHTTSSVGDPDHCCSDDGEYWNFLVVPPNTPEIDAVHEGRSTEVTFVNGETIEIPEDWGCGETAEEAWASADS